MSQDTPAGLRGHIDHFGDDLIGWVLDSASPQTPVAISVEYGYREIYRGLADIAREDLAPLLGVTPLGFHFSAAALAVPAGRVVQVYALGAEKLLLGEHLMPARKFKEGTDGWLFLDNDSNAVNQCIAGELDIPVQVMAEAARQAWLREAAMAHLGIAYRALIVPEKNAVCVARNSGVTLSPERPAARLQHLVAGLGGHLLYPFAEFQAQAEQVFSQTDTHANGRGYQILYRCLQRELPALFSRPCSEPVVQPGFLGDLGEKCHPQRTEDIVQFPWPASDTHYCLRNSIPETIAQKRQIRGELVVVHNHEAPHDCLMVFGTSSAYLAIPLLSQQFRRTLFVWSNDMDLDFIQAQQPNCVLWLVTERTLPVVGNDLTGIPGLSEKLAETIATSGAGVRHD